MPIPHLFRRLVVSTALVVALLSAPATAQQYGDIFGAVQDDENTALPGVTMELAGMGAPRLTTTDEKGQYRFLNLDPGFYHLRAELDGFSIVEQPNVVVALNRSTTINFTLTSAVEELVTVTSETPLLDERHFAKGTVISQVELETIPTAREPWAIFNQTPGVLTGNVNVGGSESGQQTAFLGLGTTVWDNDWLIDGIQITDMTGVGWSPTYYDFEQFESVDIATGGADVTKNTSGVSINMVTRRGTNEFRGTARFLSVKDDGLGFLGNSSPDFDCGDLHPDQDCDTFTTNRIEAIAEYGFEAGGAAIKDKLWFWGSYGVQDIDLIAAGGDADQTVLENTSVKVNGQVSNSNSAVASWNNGNKRVFGRGAGPTRATETTWNQRGPSAFWRFEDTHIFGSSLFLTGSYQKSDLGFALKVLSGCTDFSCPPSQETLWDSDGVWKQNYLTGFARRPEEALKLDGSYFFSTGDVTNELKFGGRVRKSTGSSNFIWPGRNIVHIAGENFGEDPGPVDFFFLVRGQTEDLGIEVEYNSLWIQDTIAAGNWTLNVGARYDLQDGVNNPGSTGPSAIPAILPSVSFTDPVKPPFDWETVTPRLGLTYALGEDRDTLLRASFSQFPSALSTFEVGWINPALGYGGYGAYAYFFFFDGEEDNNTWDGTEPYLFLFGFAYDRQNPDRNLNTMGTDFDPELTTELILGVEHAFLPEFVVGMNYTWREIDDVLSIRSKVRPKGSGEGGQPEVASDFLPDGTVSTELPDGSAPEIEVFFLDPTLEFSGFQQYENDSRKRKYDGLALTLNKRLANRWSLRGYVNWGETEWDVPQSFLDNTDPNPADDGSDQHGALFLTRSNTKGRGERYLQSGWQASLTGLVQILPDSPYGFTLASNVYAREGHVLPYNFQKFGSDRLVRGISLMAGDLDLFRLDDLLTVDLRVEKQFSANNDVSLTFGLDLFNALNEATPLSRETTLSSRTGDYLLDIVSPRVWKLGVRVSWK
jgi:hypothetical protein